eukprot:537486-Rhodomonas_salina.1
MPSDASVAAKGVGHVQPEHWHTAGIRHLSPIVLRDIQRLVPDANGDATGIGPGEWPGEAAAVATWHTAVWYLGLGDTMTKGAHRG